MMSLKNKFIFVLSLMLMAQASFAGLKELQQEAASLQQTRDYYLNYLYFLTTLTTEQSIAPSEKNKQTLEKIKPEFNEKSFACVDQQKNARLCFSAASLEVAKNQVGPVAKKLFIANSNYQKISTALTGLTNNVKTDSLEEIQNRELEDLRIHKEMNALQQQIDSLSKDQPARVLLWTFVTTILVLLAVALSTATIVGAGLTVLLVASKILFAFAFGTGLFGASHMSDTFYDKVLTNKYQLEMKLQQIQSRYFGLDGLNNKRNIDLEVKAALKKAAAEAVSDDQDIAPVQILP